MITKEALAKEIAKRFSVNDPMTGLFEQQVKFLKDESHFKIARCSRRAGKSYACAKYLLNVAMGRAEANCVYLALTKKSAKRILWGLLKRMVKEAGHKATFLENDLAIEFQNGSFVYLLGANDETVAETLRGSPWDLVVIDEVASYRGHLEELIDENITPALIDHEGTVALIGTPSQDFTSFFYKADHSESWSHHSWTMFDNPFIKGAGKFLKGLCEKKGWTKETPLVKREYFGLWARSLEDQVYLYSPSVNRVDTVPDGLTYVIGSDVGWSDDKSIVILGFNASVSDKVYIIHKEKKPHWLITDFGNRLAELSRQYMPIKIVIDPAAGGKDIAEEIKARHGILIESAKKTAKNDYIEFFNAALMGGKLFNLVNSEEDALETEYAELQWYDKSKRSEGPQANHLADACLYGWRECYAYVHGDDVEERLPSTEQEMQRNVARLWERQLIEQMESERGNIEDWESFSS